MDVVRDQDRRDADLALDHADLGPHFLAQAGIEVAERLIEQQQRRMNDEGARQRHALLLSARDLRWVAGLEAAEPDEVERLVDAAAHVPLRRLAHAQPERDVLEDGQMRKERVALEHECHVPRVHRQARHVAALQPHRPLVGLQDAGDGAQDGRLAAAGRPEQREEFAAADFQ
jgi:hypothetical protein